MALTVSGTNYLQLSSCDSSTSGGTWSGATFTADGATMKEGVGSLSCVLKTAGENEVTFTPSAAKNLYQKHLRMWILLTHGGILNTYALDGIRFWVSDGTNKGYWRVGGRDTYPGGWMNLVIDTRLACDSGTKPSDAGMQAITSMGFSINLTIAGKNVINTFFDNLIVCDGLEVKGEHDTGAITINANSAGTYTRTSGDYTADGFRVGHTIYITGYANSGNNGTKVIQSVSTTVITVTSATGMVTEGGGGDERIKGYVDMEDISLKEEATTGAWGIMRKIGGQYFLTGSLTIGASGTPTRFDPKSAVVVFENRRVYDSLYGITVVDDGASANTTDFVIGSKTGVSGIEGCVFRVQGPTQTCKFFLDASDTDVDNFRVYGSTFFDAGTITCPTAKTTATRARSSNVATIGCTAHGLTTGDTVIIKGVGGSGYNGTVTVTSTPTSDTFTYSNEGADEGQTADTDGRTIKSTVEMRNCNFETAAKLMANNAVIQNCNFVVANSQSLRVVSPHHNISNCTFIGNPYGIEFNVPGTFELSGCNFYNNTYDIDNTSGDLITLNVMSSASPPQSYTGNTDINNNVALTLTGLKPNTEVRIFEAGTTNELDGVEDSGTTFVFQYNYIPNSYIDIVLIHTAYLYYRMENYLLSSTNTTLPIQQQFDRSYDNP